MCFCHRNWFCQRTLSLTFFQASSTTPVKPWKGQLWRYGDVMMISTLIILQIFLCACDWPKRITWLNWGIFVDKPQWYSPILKPHIHTETPCLKFKCVVWFLQKKGKGFFVHKVSLENTEKSKSAAVNSKSFVNISRAHWTIFDGWWTHLPPSGVKICSHIFPWTLSVYRSSQFSRASLLENCSYVGTGSVSRQKAVLIFAPNGGNCLYI